MNAATRNSSLLVPRRPSIAESSDSRNVRSAVIIMSGPTTRDAQITRGHTRYENTYQLEPGARLSACQLRKIMGDTFSQSLKDYQYKPNCGTVAKSLADQINQQAKDQGPPRYKYVCMVVIGSTKHSAISMASRCLWNTNFDTFAEYTYKNDSVYACGVIYGFYAE